MRLLNIGAVRKAFFDTFNRSNQSGLGTASDGSLWDAIRGTFNIVSNKAEGQTPSGYPLASVSMPSEAVTINLKGVTQGSTAALWITDSGNWYGIGIDQEPVNCNCQTCSNPGNCSQYSYVCNAGNYFCDVVGNRYCSAYSTVCSARYYNFTNQTPGPCYAWTRNCNAYNSGNCNASNSSFTCNSASNPCNAFNATTFYQCNCQTCYPQYVRFIQSIANTISQVTISTVSSIVQSFKVIISAINPSKTSATATIKAYSDTNLSTQIGSDLTYTPTGVAINAKYGIMIKPSTYSQGNTIDEISIETT